MIANERFNTIGALKESKSKRKHMRNKAHSNNKFNLGIRDVQMGLMHNLSNSIYFKFLKNKNNPKDFQKYSDELEKSLNGYQLTFVVPKGHCEEDFEEKKGPNEIFMDKKDTTIIKKMYEDNKSIFTKGLASINEDSNLSVKVLKKDYPNPYQSLGIIKHNYYIYTEMNKNFLYRQSDRFHDQIKLAQKYQTKLKIKMPKQKVHVAGSRSTSNFEIPVVDLTHENRKEKITSLPSIPQADGLKLFCYYRYPNKNFPEGREQFSVTIKNANILILGGITSNFKADSLWMLNCEKLEWHKIPIKSGTNNRYGHTGLYFQNQLFIYGGKIRCNNTSVAQGLEIYNFEDGTFSDPCITKSSPIPLRRNHIAEIIGNQMLIYGGITDANEILNDCHILNLNPLKWTLCSISKYTPGPKLYGHSSALVVPTAMAINHRFTIYSYPELELGKSNNRIKEKGVYIFGGKSKEEGGLSNQLWILLLGKKPLEWVQPETNGKPPNPRYFHSMNFYEKGNFIIIHGGRNDNISSNSALNDTYIFDLENFDWMEVELYSQLNNFKVLNRCGHQSVVYGNKLLIFGGMNNNNYLGSALFIVNLDFHYSTDLRTPEQVIIAQLEKKEDPEAKKKINKLKQDLVKNQLGLVTNIQLPPIK